MHLTQPRCNITFLDFILTHCFNQIINLPTRGNLDIFCTNKPALTNEYFPIPGISDHEALYVRYVYNFSQKHNVSVPVEILWQDFKNICLDKVPTKDNPSTTTNQPWITKSVRHLCHKKKRYF